MNHVIGSGRRGHTGSRIGLTCTVIAVLGVIGCGESSTRNPAVTTAVPPSAAPTTSGTPIDQQRAEQVALAVVPGARVVSAHPDQEYGRAVWEIEVVDAAGGTHDVDLDAVTGKVIAHTTGDIGEHDNDGHR